MLMNIQCYPWILNMKSYFRHYLSHLGEGLYAYYFFINWMKLLGAISYWDDFIYTKASFYNICSCAQKHLPFFHCLKAMDVFSLHTHVDGSSGSDGVCNHRVYEADDWINAHTIIIPKSSFFPKPRACARGERPTNGRKKWSILVEQTSLH